MNILQVYSTIDEQKPVIISSCLKFIGKDYNSIDVENCLLNNIFSGLTLDDILDISAYSSVLDIMQGLKEQNVYVMSGQLAITWCSFLVKRLQVKEPWIKPEISPYQLQEKLDDLFNVVSEAPNVEVAIKQLYRRLKRLDFMTYGMNAFIYLMLNFYLYMYKNCVFVFNDFFSYDSDISAVASTQMSHFVEELGGE